jgi:hypothetical protein
MPRRRQDLRSLGAIEVPRPVPSFLVKLTAYAAEITAVMGAAAGAEPSGNRLIADGSALRGWG